jgi:cytochrome P450
MTIKINNTLLDLPLPPGAQYPWWGLGLLSQLRQNYLGFTTNLQKHYPDITYFKIGFTQIVHIFNPEIARLFLTQNANQSMRWERTSEVFAQSMGQSILVTEGQEWQRQRRILTQGFSHKRVISYAKHMVDACLESIEKLSNPNTSKPIDTHEFMTDITLDVIVRALFGQTQPIDGRAVSNAIGVLSKTGYEQLFQPITLPLWFPLPSLRKAYQAQKSLDQLINLRIEQQRTELSKNLSDTTQDTLLKMLLLTRDPEHPDQGLSAQEIRDQTMAIFQAGHETTASALTWWAGLIARHPSVAQLVQAEIDEKLGNQLPDAQTIPTLNWLNATLKEAMRLYPPAALLFTRRTLEDIPCGNYRIPKRTLVAITPAVIQRNSRWFEDADQF